jgi:hypothetical protein
MSERRWGRVTVEGWIEQNPLASTVMVWASKVDRTSPDGRVAATNAVLDHTLSPLVEFLPKPVTFKDGDVVRFEGDREVWVRVKGMWVSSAAGADMWEDYVAADYLRRGNAVRLVPAGNDV